MEDRNLSQQRNTVKYRYRNIKRGRNLDCAFPFPYSSHFAVGHTIYTQSTWQTC